ncbi:hypothetical protein DW881_01595 [Exiguobacterium sp. AM39-5BH]|nr:hypothetical protein DW881_01595 [Exiguobacterium sp. AM39-5BH]
MEQIDGGKDCVLTRGALIGTPSTLGNPPSDGRLNNQKSAEAIVPPCLETSGKGRTIKREQHLGRQSL